MTRALGRNPARRCLPISEWPAADAAVWQAALRPGDLLEGGGERAGHAAGSNSHVEHGYGRWLGWLRHTGRLHPNTAPADRITPAAVDAYQAALATCNSTATQLGRLEDLFTLASLLDPARGWQWIRDITTRVRWRDQPTRDKRARLVGADDLVGLGLELMRRADASVHDHLMRRALLFRDGLMIALLAQRPLRRANFAGLRLGRHVQQRGSGWWLLLERHETKTHEPIELPWPEALVPALQAWLAQWRPALLARHTGHSGVPAGGNALWISARGTPVDVQALYMVIRHHTERAFGTALSPHLFRDCAATSIAIEDPVHVQVASQVLGHRSQATTERHYNQARTVEATRRWQENLERLRIGAHDGGAAPH